MARLWPDAGKLIWFDVGNLPQMMEFEVDVGFLLNLPFKKIAVAATDDQGWDLVVVLMGGESDVAVSGMAIHKGKSFPITPFAYLPDPVTPTAARFIWHEDYGKPDPKSCMATLGIIDYFLRSLSHPTQAYTPTPKPTAMNRLRMKKGKPALSYQWHTVTVEPPTEKPAPQGGTHASPRLHERRGHWRTRNGTRHWVRACLVGDPDRGVIEKDYRVRENFPPSQDLHCAQ